MQRVVLPGHFRAQDGTSPPGKGMHPWKSALRLCLWSHRNACLHIRIAVIPLESPPPEEGYLRPEVVDYVPRV